MALLHPDKLVGVTRAIQNRPRVPRPSIAVAAARVAGGTDRKYLGKAKVPGEPGLLENMAYQLRAEHEERHLNRMARRVDQSLQRPQRPAVGQAQAVAKPQGGQAIEPAHVNIHVEAPEKPLPQRPGPGPIRRY